MTDHEKARAWREGLNLSRADLSKLTGYSQASIIVMERGTDSRGDTVQPWAWQRYRLTCAAIAAGLTSFDWGPVTVTIAPTVADAQKR